MTRLEPSAVAIRFASTLHAIDRHSGLSFWDLREFGCIRGLRQLQDAGLVRFEWYSKWTGGFHITDAGSAELAKINPPARQRLHR